MVTSIAPPPKFSAGNWQTPCPPPPPTSLQQPPQMPAADFLLPVCCCPPISCGLPCTLQHSCSYQRPPPEYFCHQTQPPPNACSRCSAAILLLPSNFLWCTLHPVPCSTVAAAHPCPLNGGAPPPNFLLPVPCSEMANSLPPPPTPAADFMPSLLSPTTAPPNACSRFSAASLLLPSNFLWCTLHPAAQLQPAHPCPLHGGVPPPTPPPNFRLQTPEGASSRFSAASSLLLRPAHVPTQKTSSSKFVTALVSVVGVADAQDQGKRCLTQSPAPFGCDWRGAAVWQFSPLPI